METDPSELIDGAERRKTARKGAVAAAAATDGQVR
jgi:hypothetical protein